MAAIAGSLCYSLSKAAGAGFRRLISHWRPAHLLNSWFGQCQKRKEALVPSLPVVRATVAATLTAGGTVGSHVERSERFLWK